MAPTRIPHALASFTHETAASGVHFARAQPSRPAAIESIKPQGSRKLRAMTTLLTDSEATSKCL
jgi:hypothetical protein